MENRKTLRDALKIIANATEANPLGGYQQARGIDYAILKLEKLGVKLEDIPVDDEVSTELTKIEHRTQEILR